jgi:hypothetical protein
MALHRDIYWVGRQWAVTGLGIQAVDQRLKGAFDVDVARLWEDDLPQRMRALAWIHLDEFNKALEMARERFPQPPRKVRPLVESVMELIAPTPVVSEPPKQASPIFEVSPAPLTAPIAPAATELPPRQIKAQPSVSQPAKRAAPMPTKPAVPITEVSPAPSAASIAPAAVELQQPPIKAQPLQLRIEQVSAKFVPSWRIRHQTPA